MSIKGIFDFIITLSTTDIVAILALIVATYGAILSTVIYTKEKLKITLSYLDKNYLSLSKNELTRDSHGFSYFTYSENRYCLAIYVRICNNSKSNTTINSFILNDKYVFDSSSPNYACYPVGFKRKSDEVLSKKYTNLIICKPLISLAPFETKEGYIVFDDIANIPSKINIKINAVQKSKSYKLKLVLNDCTKIESEEETLLILHWSN